MFDEAVEEFVGKVDDLAFEEEAVDGVSQAVIDKGGAPCDLALLEFLRHCCDGG